jgi:hypothetical protein
MIERIIEVHTRCGRVIKQRPSEMSDWQLQVLLKNNADAGCNPLDIAALRDELQRRRG